VEQVLSIHDRAELERVLRRDPIRHLFALCDLDDRYWPRTVWYGLEVGGVLQEIVLVYLSSPPPVVMALTGGDGAAMRTLLRSAARLLPPRCYAHLSPGLAETLAGTHKVRPRGTLRKMALTDRAAVLAVDPSGVGPLAAEDLPELERFYAASYPNGGFAAAAFQPGRYAGLRLDGVLVGVAGVHAWSAAYRVAALGNIVTHPAFRGRGIATRVTASLCRWLLGTVDHVGLVVMADNHAAIRSYEKIGFSHHSDVEACSLETR